MLSGMPRTFLRLTKCSGYESAQEYELSSASERSAVNNAPTQLGDRPVLCRIALELHFDHPAFETKLNPPRQSLAGLRREQRRLFCAIPLDARAI